MKKHLINALLAGAVTVLSLAALVSCNADRLEKLETRVTTLEGYVHQLQIDLINSMVVGATVTNAVQKDGIWTLTLSDGKVITISPAAAGGTEVSVEETADAFVIKVGNDVYAIPKVSSAAVNSVVFVPEYGDDLVIIGNDGAMVSFLVTPALPNLDGVELSVADAREVLTRAGDGLFGLNNPALDGGLLKVNIKGLAAEAGKTYVVALKLNVKGTAISSNYFRVQMGDDFNFDPEALEDPVFIDEVSAEAKGDSWSAFLPDTKADFLGEFNFKDLYKTLPAGTVTFELAPADQQNGQVSSRYDFFKSCLSADGSWKMQGRPGTSCYDKDNDGIYIYCKANDQIKNKVWWRINDPVRTAFEGKFGRDDDATYGDIHYSPDFPEAQHVEYRPMVPAGAGRYDFIELIMKSTPGEENDYLWFQHGDAPKAIEWIQNLEITVNEPGDLVYSDGSALVLGDLGKKLTAHSRGLWWQSTQPSAISSQRQNLTEEQKQAVKDQFGTECNGEIINGRDGNIWDTHADYGWDLDGKAFVTNESYTGTAFRFGIGLRFEYDYGQIRIGGWHTFYIFFNRRVAPEGATDYLPQ